MTATARPAQVLSSRLDAVPAQVWAQVSQSGFIAGYLGASLPPADLATWPLQGAPLQGRAPCGGPLALQVTGRQPPASLSLCLHTPAGPQALHLSISACGTGSRLTVLHQPDDGTASAGHHPLDDPAQAQALPRQLAAPLPALLQAAAPVDAARLQAALQYLAGTATLVARLRGVMGPRQGYATPAGGGFSLVQHLWHLADVETHGWSQRFLVLQQAGGIPLLPGVDGDRLAVEGRYQQRPWRGAALRFVRHRQRSLQALQRCTAAQWQRAVHFSGQRCTGSDVLAAMLAHDHEHRTEMAALWPPAD